jgi:hypothetical protein
MLAIEQKNTNKALTTYLRKEFSYYHYFFPQKIEWLMYGSVSEVLSLKETLYAINI